MQTTPKGIGRLAPSAPHDVSMAQEQALREAYREMMGPSEDWWAVSKGRRHTHLLPLRAARRAQTLGRSKAMVIAYYLTVLSAVMADYPDEDDLTLEDALIEEQRRDLEYDCAVIRAAKEPSPHALLTVDAMARQKQAATQTVRGKVARMLKATG